MFGRSALGVESVGTPRIDVRGLGVGMFPAPTPQLWEVPTMSAGMALVGLDVHQAQTVAAVLDPVSGELRVERGDVWFQCEKRKRGAVTRAARARFGSSSERSCHAGAGGGFRETREPPPDR